MRPALLSVLLLVQLVSCGGGSDSPSGPPTPKPPAAVSTVTVSPVDVALTPGGTSTLSATARDAQGNTLTGRAVTWNSSSGTVATVSQSGLVTAVAAGTASISALVEGHSGSATVTVSPVPVASITVPSATAAVVAGQTVQLDATGNALADRLIAWTSTAETIATVNGSGLVAGVAVGTSTIRATSEGKSAEVVVTVSPKPVASIELSVTAATMVHSQPLQLVATPKDAAGAPLTGRTVAWSTSASTVATVSIAGLVTADQPGSATITATSEGRSASAVITVSGGGEWVTATGGTVTAAGGAVVLEIPAGAVAAGTAFTATAITTPGQADSVVAGTTFEFGPSGVAFAQPVTVRLRYTQASLPTGSDPTLLKVRRFTNGRWTALVGKSTVVDNAARTVTTQLSSFSSYGIGCCALPEDVNEIELSAETDTVAIGSTVQLVQRTRDVDGRLLPVQGVYTSEKPEIATVSNTGLVLAVSPGTTTISAKVDIAGGAPRIGTLVITVSAELELGVGFGLEQFSNIPTGSYLRGSTDGHSDAQPVRAITISAFMMQKTEVTQGQWRLVMTGTSLANPSHFSSCGDVCPVEQVSWDDIQQFLTRLNQQDPGKGYRLPTEAEWEYAARAGTTGDYNVVNKALDSLGWVRSNAQLTTWPVAQKLPNAWDLFDMHGNVKEWVNDWYDAWYYATSPATNPPGPTMGTYRVLRGGSWADFAFFATSAARFYWPTNYRWNSSGFRLAKYP